MILTKRMNAVGAKPPTPPVCATPSLDGEGDVVLRFGVMDSDRHPHFDAFFSAFSRTFHTNGVPWVSRERFRTLFSMNRDAGMQEKCGALRYEVVYAYNEATDKVVGGGVHIAMLPEQQALRESNADATYFAGYIFTDSSVRGGGLAGKLIAQREQRVKAFAREHSPALRDTRDEDVRVLGFNEQNDPMKMTLAEIMHDIDISSPPETPRDKRLTPWRRLIGSRQQVGWQTVGFDYCEPSAKGDQGVDYMAFGVKNAESPLSSSLVQDVIRIYTIIRRDGDDPRGEPRYAPMMRQLKTRSFLNVVNDADFYKERMPYFEALRDHADRMRETGRSCEGALFTMPVGKILAEIDGYRQGDHERGVAALQEMLSDAASPRLRKRGDLRLVGKRTVPSGSCLLPS